MFIGIKVGQRSDYYSRNAKTQGFSAPYWAYKNWVYIDFDMDDIIGTFRAPQVGTMMPLFRHEKAQEIIELIEGYGWHVDGDRFWPVVEAVAMRQYLGNRDSSHKQRIATHKERPGEGRRLVGDSALSERWDSDICVICMSDEEAKSFPAWMTYTHWRGYEAIIVQAQRDLPKATTMHPSMDSNTRMRSRTGWSDMGLDAGHLAEWFERPLERRHVTLWDMYKRAREIAAFEIDKGPSSDVEAGCRQLASRPLAREAVKQTKLSEEEWERKKAHTVRATTRKRGFDFEELDSLREVTSSATLPEGYGMGFPDRVLNNWKTVAYLPVAHDLSGFTDKTRMHEKRYMVGNGGYAYQNITLPVRTKSFPADPEIINLRNVQRHVSSDKGRGRVIARLQPFVLIGQGRGTNEPIAMIGYAFPVGGGPEEPRKDYVYALKIIELGNLPSTPATVNVYDRQVRRAFTRAPRLAHAANICLNYLRGLAKSVEPLREPGAKLDNPSWSRRGIQFAAPHLGMFKWTRRRYGSRRGNEPLNTRECIQTFAKEVCGHGLFREVEREEETVNPGANVPVRRFELDND